MLCIIIPDKLCVNVKGAGDSSLHGLLHLLDLGASQRLEHWPTYFLSLLIRNMSTLCLITEDTMSFKPQFFLVFYGFLNTVSAKKGYLIKGFCFQLRANYFDFMFLHLLI